MKTCYTVITNGYDELKPPDVISDGWEYVVFSDKFLDVYPWQCTITDKPNREVKIIGGELFPNLTLYVDGSIRIIGDLDEFVKEVPTILTAWKHPHRKELHEEAEAIVRLKGCDPAIVKRQMKRYDPHSPLAACGVLLRDMNNVKVRRGNSLWYCEHEAGCGRDQLSFWYSYKKFGLKPYLFGNDIFNKYFFWGKHENKAAH